MSNLKRCCHCRFELPPEEFYSSSTQRTLKRYRYASSGCKLCNSVVGWVRKRIPALDKRVVRVLCRMARVHKDGGGK